MIEFKGTCKGIELVPRGLNDKHICIKILTEDDENWFVSDKPFSSFWIDDLIEQLQKAKVYIETQEPDICDGRQYGYKFKT